MKQNLFVMASLALAALFALSCQTADEAPRVSEPGPDIGTVAEPEFTTTDLFVTLLGKTPEESLTKVQTAVNLFFNGTTGESTTPATDRQSASNNGRYRNYYELPQDPSKAFIYSADSNDIRSEGMSYGMMIAVQMNMKDQFDRLWHFAKDEMQYPSTSSVTAWRNYFRWQLTNINVSNSSSWTWSKTDVTPAPDGEVYFAMALYLADRRWGSAGTFNYKAEADAITNAMINNKASGNQHPIIHTTQNKISFCPIGAAYTFSDPSYHLPSFFDAFAAWGPEANVNRWLLVAHTSRQFLIDSAHPTTGLHPDYAAYDGTPVKDTGGTRGNGLSGTEHDTFRYDAWRLPMNLAMDWIWWGKDTRIQNQAIKYHEFFTNYKGTNNTTAALFTLDGKTGTGGGSTALVATLAAASQVSDHADKTFWVQSLWNVQQQSGLYRYYQQCVYLLGMLVTTGNYQVSWE